MKGGKWKVNLTYSLCISLINFMCVMKGGVFMISTVYLCDEK